MVQNITKNTVISKDAKVAQSMSDKYLGMILKKNSGGLILTTRFGIHTFFMDRSIDVFIISGDEKIVATCENLPPWSVYFWNPKFEKVIEVPQGSIRKSRSAVGDKVSVL